MNSEQEALHLQAIMLNLQPSMALQPVIKPKKNNNMSKIDVPTTNPQFEAALQAYIEKVLANEEKEFKSDLEPFSTHADKIRKNIADTMRNFYHSYQTGYALLVKALEDLSPDENFKISAENSKTLDDILLFEEFLSKGKAVYELFGFSTNTLKSFYDAAVHLMENKQYEEAKHGFYFLVTIAPLFVSAWLGLALCYSEHDELENARTTCEYALKLDPENIDSYLVLVRLLMQMHDKNEAVAVCDKGIAYAQEHQNEEWANDLVTTLEHTKSTIE